MRVSVLLCFPSNPMENENESFRPSSLGRLCPGQSPTGSGSMGWAQWLTELLFS